MRFAAFDRKDSIWSITLIYICLISMCIVTLYPMLNLLSIALRPGNRLFQTSLRLIPDNATFENFRIALFDRPFLLWLGNSMLVACMTAFIGVVVSCFCGYAFSRFKFIGKSTIMTGFLLTQIFPAPMLLLPSYILLRNLSLMNKYEGLVLVYLAMAIPFCTWMLKGFFDTVPISLEESAHMDGASTFRTFFSIVIPLSLPALGITALFSFMTAWSEYIMSRIIITRQTMITLPVGLVNLQGQFNTDWGIYSAAALLTALPAMALFLSMSKFMVKGLTLGGVKG